MGKYVLSWKTRQAGTAQQNHDDTRTLLATFAKWQPPADQNWLQFLGSVDGMGGLAVIETDNLAGLHAEIAKFVTFNEFEVLPVVDIAESVNMLAAALEFRDSI